MEYNRETVVGGIVIIGLIVAFALTGGVEAILWFLGLVLVSIWSWWLYTVEVKSRLVFYAVKVPANILLNPLLILLLIGSYISFRVKHGKKGYMANDSLNKH